MDQQHLSLQIPNCCQSQENVLLSGEVAERKPTNPIRPDTNKPTDLLGSDSPVSQVEQFSFTHSQMHLPLTFLQVLLNCIQLEICAEPTYLKSFLDFRFFIPARLIWLAGCRQDKTFVPTCTIFQMARITANFPVAMKIYDDHDHNDHNVAR